MIRLCFVSFSGGAHSNLTFSLFCLSDFFLFFFLFFWLLFHFDFLTSIPSNASGLTSPAAEAIERRHNMDARSGLT